MRPKMLDIKLSFVGIGFDFFAVPTLFNVKKFCLITLQKSDLRKRNGVQEAAGSNPVTRTKIEYSCYVIVSVDALFLYLHRTTQKRCFRAGAG